MKKQDNHVNLSANQMGKQGNIYLPGYALYPADEDIFNKCKKEGNIIPELLHKIDPIGVLLTICWSASSISIIRSFASAVCMAGACVVL